MVEDITWYRIECWCDEEKSYKPYDVEYPNFKTAKQAMNYVKNLEDGPDNYRIIIMTQTCCS
jgi:hypothetical protein